MHSTDRPLPTHQWVCGNYRSGVAFPDCVTFGYDHAKVVQEFLGGGEAKSGVAAKEAVAAA